MPLSEFVEWDEEIMAEFAECDEFTVTSHWPGGEETVTMRKQLANVKRA